MGTAGRLDHTLCLISSINRYLQRPDNVGPSLPFTDGPVLLVARLLVGMVDPQRIQMGRLRWYYVHCFLATLRCGCSDTHVCHELQEKRHNQPSELTGS